MDTGVEPAQVGIRGLASPRLRPALGTWTRLGVLTAFWVNVAASNVLYAHGMSASLDPHGTQHIFAAWPVRLLQHLLLYPILVGCVFASLRIGWRRPWQTLPVQILLALLFAFLASPLLEVAHLLAGTEASRSGSLWSAVWQLSSEDFPMHVASTASFLLAYGFAIALLTSFALYQRYRDSELQREALERAFTDARLAALRMQLSPHTLFNLLHTIRGQIDWNPATAQAMIVQLGDLLRRLLAAGEREFAPLPAEIEFTRLYLQLQQRRFPDRLTVSLPSAAFAEPAAMAWVPSLILQPLIENAIVHGLAGHSGPVEVLLQSQATPAGLVLRVINTVSPAPGTAAGPVPATESAAARGSMGAGVSAGSAAAAAAGGAATGAGVRLRIPFDQGIGLRNVRERLRVLFGGRAWLTTACDGRRWVAELHLPLLLERQLPSGT
ncbi:MAG TPA: histidine kinase [Steroidobacteraceae bacterium]|nr:histidine kinase [Steroidobacteraceae bacterium]